MPAINQKSLKFKFTIFFLSFCLFFSSIAFVFTKPVIAFESNNSTYQFQFEEAIKMDEMNLQSFVNETIKAIMGSVFHFIIGTVFPTISNKEPSAYNPQNIKNDGLLSAGFSILSNLYATPPASGINYIASIGRDLKIIGPAYAQEKVYGYNAMEPLRQIWKTFRNISYILFVLILIAMGFAIMFRVKISPQAVITLQAALPRIVIALILITFSYAIVGFILDITFSLNKIIDQIFTGLLHDPYLSWPGFRDKLTDFFQGLTINVLESDYVMGPPVHIWQQALVAWFVFSSFVNLVFPIVGLILGFICAIIVLIALFRCLFVIIKAFTMIIVNLIFAPFRILIGVLPGNNAMGDWFKDLLANAAVLPAMLTAFAVSSYLIFAGVGVSVSGEYWGAMFSFFGPRWSGTSLLPSENLIPVTIRIVLPFCGLALLLLAPKVAEIIQSFITKKPFDYGSAIGQSMQPAIVIGKKTGAAGAEKYASHQESLASQVGGDDKAAQRARLTRKLFNLPKRS